MLPDAINTSTARRAVAQDASPSADCCARHLESIVRLEAVAVLNRLVQTSAALPLPMNVFFPHCDGDTHPRRLELKVVKVAVRLRSGDFALQPKVCSQHIRHYAQDRPTTIDEHRTIRS
jgi:hypothetical protein